MRGGWATPFDHLGSELPFLVKGRLPALAVSVVH